MRLTPKEAEIIRSAARQRFGAGARMYLFGLRPDDAERGGDIDFYIETDDVVPQRPEKTLRFRVELVQQMGELKIDVVVKDTGMEEQVSTAPPSSKALRNDTDGPEGKARSGSQDAGSSGTGNPAFIRMRILVAM